MNKILNKKFIVLIICLLTSIVCLAFVGTTTKANAAEPISVKSLSTFKMQDGVSIRMNADGHNGLRYAVEMSKNEYDALMAQKGTTYTNITFGIIIVPTDIVAKYGALNEENLFGENAVYTFNKEDTTKTYLLNLTSPNMIVNNQDNMILYGSITDLKKKNIKRDFTAVGYVKGDKADGNEYLITNGPVRKMSKVAQIAIEKGDDVNNVIKDSYSNPFIVESFDSMDNIQSNAKNTTVVKSTDNGVPEGIHGSALKVSNTYGGGAPVEVTLNKSAMEQASTEYDFVRVRFFIGSGVNKVRISRKAWDSEAQICTPGWNEISFSKDAMNEGIFRIASEAPSNSTFDLYLDEIVGEYGKKTAKIYDFDDGKFKDTRGSNPAYSETVDATTVGAPIGITGKAVKLHCQDFGNVCSGNGFTEIFPNWDWNIADRYINNGGISVETYDYINVRIYLDIPEGNTLEMYWHNDLSNNPNSKPFILNRGWNEVKMEKSLWTGEYWSWGNVGLELQHRNLAIITCDIYFDAIYGCFN